jgi:hypothetical protein
VSDERAAWDRRDGETPRAYAAFRVFRDLGPTRTVDRVYEHGKSAYRWCTQWDWHARATAWDDAQHMIEDAERLEAIRTMHRTHRVAARAAMTLALQALRQLQPEIMTASEVVRLLDIAQRLERQTLTTSIEELQGVEAAATDDPWERIARELSGA